MRKLVKAAHADPGSSVDLFDADRRNQWGEHWCVAPAILPAQVAGEWSRYCAARDAARGEGKLTIALRPDGEALSAVCVRDGLVVGYATAIPYLFEGDEGSRWIALHLLDYYPAERPAVEAWLGAHRTRPWVIRRATHRPDAARGE